MRSRPRRVRTTPGGWKRTGLATVVIATIGAVVRGQEASELLKQNLDLPQRAEPTSPPDDEERLDVIRFYGQSVEGDGFFYVVDRSLGMQDRGDLQRAKIEIARNVAGLSNGSHVGVVFFDVGVMKYPASGRPVEIGPGTRRATIEWIHRVSGGGGSCLMEGLQAALRFAKASTAKSKVILYVGDGGGTCRGANETTYLRDMLDTIAAQNVERVPIHCLGVAMDPSRSFHEEILKQLSRRSGGTYRRIR